MFLSETRQMFGDPGAEGLYGEISLMDSSFSPGEIFSIWPRYTRSTLSVSTIVPIPGSRIGVR